MEEIAIYRYKEVTNSTRKLIMLPRHITGRKLRTLGKLRKVKHKRTEYFRIKQVAE